MKISIYTQTYTPYTRTHTHCSKPSNFCPNANSLSTQNNRNDTVIIIFVFISLKPFSITTCPLSKKMEPKSSFGTMECIYLSPHDPHAEGISVPAPRFGCGPIFFSLLLHQFTYLMHRDVIGKCLLTIDQIVFHLIWNFKIGLKIFIRRRRHRCNCCLRPLFCVGTRYARRT